MTKYLSKPPLLILFAVLFGLLLLWPVLHNLSSENDFDLFVMAAQRWKVHESVYQNPIIHGRYYYYSPLFVTLLQPFLWLHDLQTDSASIFGGYRWSFIIAKATWSIINVYIVYYFLKEIRSRFTFRKISEEYWFWGLSLLLGYRWIFLNLWHSQLTLFLLWAAYHALNTQRTQLVSQWWSMILGVNFKIIPGFWLLKLGLEKKWEDIAFIAAGFILLLFIPTFFFPNTYVIQETLDWLQRINPLKSQHVMTLGEGGFIDVASLVVKYATDSSIENEPNVAWVHWDVHGVFWASQVLRLSILGGIISLWYTIRKSRVFEPDFLVFALFSMGIPLIFPHQRDYSMAFYLPALLYLIYIYLTQKYWMNSILSALFFVSLFLMGNIIFFEMLSYEFRVWLIGVRLQGFGALLFYVCFGGFVWDYCRDSVR